jgi:hypothetical protein
MVSVVGRTLNAFFGFLSYSIHSVWAWGPLLLLAIALVVSYRRAQPIERRNYCFMAPLPAIWVFVGLWGAAFWVDWQTAPVIPNPKWISYVIWVSLAAFMICGAGLIALLRGARIFAAIYALMNLYFMLVMAFLALMAVTGDWL